MNDPDASGNAPTSVEEEARRQLLAQLRRRARAIQDRVAERLGVTGRDRVEIVSEMLSRQEEDRVSYWLRIVLALGIATLGLVLNSTGVVIGAMLISPLMEPIVALGMGLAVGSPYLTLRSSVRLAASVVVVVGTAALITLALPFNSMTPEIAARTSPTLIDLAVAGFCALAAGFTTVRRSSDTAAAAAGTAIGIALVPPVCVIGYGIGIGRADVAAGASMLFTANLCAIAAVTVVLFFGLGFDVVDIRRLESTEVTATTRVARVASRLRRAFGTRYGGILRLLLPAMLLAAVYFPLRTALREVAWKVRVQGEVERAIEAVAPGDTAVRTAISVESEKVTVRLVIVGSPHQAQQMKAELRTEIAAIAGVIPTVEILAVPDQATLESFAQAAPVALPEHPAAPTHPDLDLVRTTVDDVLTRHWPADGGDILSWQLQFDPVVGPTVHLLHTGAPIGPVGRAMLSDMLAELLGTVVQVIDEPVELGAWTAAPDEVVAWLPRLAQALATARTTPGVRACVTRGPSVRHVAAPAEPPPPPNPDAPARAGPPPPPPVPKLIEVQDPAAAAANAMLSATHHDVVVAKGEASGPRWRVELTTSPCPVVAATAPSSAPGDDGSANARDDL